MEPNDTRTTTEPRKKNRKAKPRRRKKTHHQRKNQLQHAFTNRLESNAITNLSDHTLTEGETKLLTKGLSYVPEFKNYNTTTREHVQEFIRGINIDDYFKDKPPTKKLLPPNKNEKWNPPGTKEPKIQSFTDGLRDTYNKTMDIHPKHTPTKDHTQRRAINNLINNKSITIKRADKGGSVVILNTHDYIKTALTHLTQPTVYQEVTLDHTKEVAENVTSYIEYLSATMQLHKDIANHIKPAHPTRTPLFYYLPKIHKPNNPPRPIISGCDGPTDNLSRYITTILNPLAQIQPSYLIGTKHFLQLIEALPKAQENTILVTADVTSLYTNIPHEEGINAAIQTIEAHRDLLPPHTPNSKVIKSLLLHILKENYFDFLDKHYLQIQGTAMGTKMAPPYANIFMANLERGLTNIAPQHISIWKRFIDDIFFIWTGSMDSLVEFQHTANTLHPSIKFTFESSISEVNFLDTTVYIDESRKFRTKLFRKPTDKNLILHFDSHHPLHIKRNIVYSQALRYKRIISDPLTLEEELRTLKRIFLSRRYPPGLVAQQFKKALLIPRTSLLTDRLKNQSPPQRRRLLKLPHHPATKAIQTQVRKLWHQHIDNKEPNTTTIWSGPPRILQTTDQSLKDILMNTRTTPP